MFLRAISAAGKLGSRRVVAKPTPGCNKHESEVFIIIVGDQLTSGDIK